MSDPQNGAELLARIQPTLKEVRFQVCLRPDLLNDHEAAEKELEEARKGDVASERLATKTSPETRRIAERIQKLEAEIEDTSPWFTVRALPTDEFTLLTEQHPPRKDHRIDMFLGYNKDSVLADAARKGMVDPVFDDASWTELRSKLNISEWEAVLNATDEANGVNAQSLPKSVLAATVLGLPASDSK